MSECAPICGDSKLKGSEECDDGGVAGGDGCSSTCKVEVGWSCSWDSACGHSACSPICGDALILGGEQCDDGDSDSDDG